MHLGRNLTNGAMGGLIRGAEIGLVEALFHLFTHGAPDLWSPVYGVVLYGLLGLPFGIGGGIAATVVELLLRRTKWKVEPFLPYVMGEVAAMVPLLGFALFYLANVYIYLEQGVPLTGLAGIVGILGVLSLINLVVGRATLHDKGVGRMLLKPAGSVVVWLGAAVIALVVALLPLQSDPRTEFAAGKPVPAALQDAPNVLFIMVDTLRADHLGAGFTPNLDQLGNDGIVFDNAFAQASWTRSSGASLFTSRLPSGHNADTKSARLSEDAVLWSEVLQDGGVTTGALINNINLTAGFGFDQGFDSFLYEAPSWRFGATESVFQLTYYKVVHKLAEKILGGPKDVTAYYQPADVVLSDAQSFIEANRDGRWALYLQLMEPHDPYFEHPALEDPAAPAFNGVHFARAEVEHPDPADVEYLRGVYKDEVRWLDQEVAPFFEWLRSEGLYDNTFIVLTADHGEEFYEHGGWWHGTTLYDEQIHVPLVVKPAGGAYNGLHVPWQVRNVDVAPTLAAAMGLEPDASWAGEDLVSGVDAWQASLEQAEADRQAAWMAALAEAELLDENGAPVADLPEELAAPVVPVVDPCDVSAFERLVVAEEDFEGNVLGAIRKSGMKLMRANEGNPRGLDTEMLFEVRTDAGEEDNLVGQSRPVCGQYLSDWSQALGDELGATVLQAREGGVTTGEAVMTRAECERLVALGYMDSCDHL